MTEDAKVAEAVTPQPLPARHGVLGEWSLPSGVRMHVSCDTRGKKPVWTFDPPRETLTPDDLWYFNTVMVAQIRGRFELAIALVGQDDERRSG